MNSGVSRCRSRVCSGGSVNPSPPGFCPELDAGAPDEVAEVGGQPAGAPEDLAGLLVAGHQPGLDPERQREVAHRVVLAVLPQRGHRVEAVTAQRHERVLGDEAHRIQAPPAAPGEVLPGDEARHPCARCRHPTREGVARRPAGARGDHVPTLPHRPSCPSGRVQGRAYGWRPGVTGPVSPVSRRVRTGDRRRAARHRVRSAQAHPAQFDIGQAEEHRGISASPRARGVTTRTGSAPDPPGGAADERAQGEQVDVQRRARPGRAVRAAPSGAAG